jgi:hypothetical protein
LRHQLGQAGRALHAGQDGVDRVPRVVVEPPPLVDVDQGVVADAHPVAQVVAGGGQRAQRPGQLVEVDQGWGLRRGGEPEQQRSQAVGRRQRGPQHRP